jgi:3-hydroxyacyl-CoA dehydrogenase/enoyl-CoA hydratase/3-hydroxybutyryl-CoA epimerase
VNHIQLERTGNGTAHLIFDRPDSSANIFDEATLTELNEHLASLEQSPPPPKGLILRSAKPSIFIAGADIKSILSNPDPGEIDRLIKLGQDVFQRLAELPFPTVAAIHGACVGGGFEITLACDYRIASPDSTKIGLPETNLGILPGWGGSARLPRLIGLPKALTIILQGKTVPAAYAKKLGMIDQVAPKENLTILAERYLSKGKAKRRRFGLVNNRLVARILKARVGKQVMTKTRGNYPAIPKALEVVTQGIQVSLANALALERDAIKELAATPAARNLIRVFFLQERVRKQVYAKDLKDLPAIGRAAVVGAGIMGAGITQWLSSRGLPVILTDIGPEQLASGMATIGKLYRAGVKRRIFSPTKAQRGIDRVSPATGTASLRRVDLVIEAAVETLEIKKKIFQDLDQRTSPDTILATNTSALPVSEIAAATSRPDKVIGIHFFNPVHRMQLVEIVVGDQTSPETVQLVLTFVQGIGKLPVISKDRPGFIVNRILLPYLIEAGRLFDEGADMEAIDRAMLDFGMPMGPLRLIDEVGMDVAVHVAKTLHSAFGDRLSAPPMLQKLVDSGLLGRKAGKGFYRYHSKGKETPNPDAVALRRQSGGTPGDQELQERMAGLMVAEAQRCLDEGVTNSGDDIDLAMIMGTGFAPFRGGPLTYAASLTGKPQT